MARGLFLKAWRPALLPSHAVIQLIGQSGAFFRSNPARPRFPRTGSRRAGPQARQLTNALSCYKSGMLGKVALIP